MTVDTLTDNLKLIQRKSKTNTYFLIDCREFSIFLNMENYKKGKNIEEPLDRDNISIPNLPFNFLWMQVFQNSHVLF